MSAVRNYSDVSWIDRNKQTNCIDCQKKFLDSDKVVICPTHYNGNFDDMKRYSHIFHEKCWPGTCPTTECKRERSERSWKSTSDIIGGIVVVVAFTAIMATLARLQPR